MGFSFKITISKGRFRFLLIAMYVFLACVGGHNIIVLAHELGQYTQLGTTVDDAIGEAFDKTAKWLGLDLRRSGGPAVEELALEGDSKSVMFNVSVKLVCSFQVLLIVRIMYVMLLLC